MSTLVADLAEILGCKEDEASIVDTLVAAIKNSSTVSELADICDLDADNLIGSISSIQNELEKVQDELAETQRLLTVNESFLEAIQEAFDLSDRDVLMISQSSDPAGMVRRLFINGPPTKGNGLSPVESRILSGVVVALKDERKKQETQEMQETQEGRNEGNVRIYRLT